MQLVCVQIKNVRRKQKPFFCTHKSQLQRKVVFTYAVIVIEFKNEETGTLHLINVNFPCLQENKSLLLQSNSTLLSDNKSVLPQTPIHHQDESYKQEKEPTQADTEHSKDDQQWPAEEMTQEVDVLQKGVDLIRTEKLQQIHTGQDTVSAPGNVAQELQKKDHREPLEMGNEDYHLPEIEIAIEGNDEPIDTEEQYSDTHEIHSLEMEPGVVEVHEKGHHLNNSNLHTL